jgi:type I restriction enzyme, S subunit
MWQIEPLASLATVYTDGDWIESKDQSTDGIRLIQTGNVGEGQFKDRGEKARFVSFDTFKRLRCTEIFPGDCLISRLPDPVGRACLVPANGHRMITAVDCTIVRFDQAKLLPKYFTYYSQSSQYLEAVEAETTGTTRNRISRARLGLVPVTVAPLPEQSRIVAILDEAFECIATARANTEKNLQNARELFERHHASVFSGAWEESVNRSLGEIASFRNGINYTKQSKGCSVPIIGVKDFQNHFWVPMDDLDSVTLDGDLSETDTLEEGDILSVRSNGNPALIGRCMLVGKVSDRVSHSGFTIRIRLQPGNVLPAYVCHFLKSREVRQKLVAGGNGLSIKSLNQGMLSEIVIPLAPLESQQRVIAEIEEMSESTASLAIIAARKLAALDELKKSLLHQAFSGAL